MNRRFLADAILLLIAFVWGTTFVLVQNAIQVLPPFSFLFVRFSIAFLLLLPVLFMQRRKKRERIALETGRAWKGGLVLGWWLFAGYALQTVGLLYTTSSKAGFITGLSVVLVPFFSFLILKTAPRLPAVLGSILAMIGLYFLTLGDAFQVNPGDLLVFLCAIAFALQIVYTGKYAHHHDPLELTTIQLGFVGLFNFLFVLFFEDGGMLLHPGEWLTPPVVLALIITSLFATSLAFLAQTALQRYTTPTRVAIIFSMEPVFAALTGILIAGDPVTVKTVIGSLLILVGMILAEIPHKWGVKVRNHLKEEIGK
ncbi:putative permease, DMT superfamily [[Clostridium] ultunense Esp]|uniref:DMT family transporter n=1 Tax=Thermicanus aegyptius TaxID=94009 RepID=UPI0002B70117|nr:DMT family transporter [Thermicanus aegyptius]CCQ92252.1 putative permease, DMT superfamily [[Clostridium] ultunense Esp]